MAVDIQEATSWPVNELGEIVAQAGVGTNNVVGWLPESMIPVDANTNKLAIAGLTNDLSTNLIFNDSSEEAIASNMAVIQSALDKGGDVRIEGNGVLYYPGRPDVPLGTIGDPCTLKIGSNTGFYSGPGIAWEQKPGSQLFGIIQNKNFLSNKIQITGWTLGSLVLAHREVEFTLASPMDLREGDYVIIQGDMNSGYGWDDGYRVEAVDTVGAATKFKTYIPKNDLNSINISPLDTVTAYKADGNFTIDIRGSISNTGAIWWSGSIQDQLQPEPAFVLLNKVKQANLNLPNITEGNCKGFVAANWYNLNIATFRKRNVGAGVTLCGPGRTCHIEHLINEGQEDVLLLQNLTYSGAVTMGLKDADGTESGGDISGVSVGRLEITHSHFRSIFLWATNDQYNVRKPYSIDGLYIGSVLIRANVSNDGAASLVNAVHYPTAAGGGGHIGPIHIGSLHMEDGGQISNNAPALLWNGAQLGTTRTDIKFGGFIIDSITIAGSRTNSVTGLRQPLAVLGQNMAGTVVDQVTIKTGVIHLDLQAAPANPYKLVLTGDNCIVRTSNLSGVQLRNKYRITSPSVAVGGTGYVVGDIVFSNSADSIKPAIFKVTAVSGGVVTAITMVNGGSYATQPSSTFGITGGSGTGLTISWVGVYQTSWMFGCGGTASGFNVINLNACLFDLPGNSGLMERITAAQVPTININNCQMLKLNSIASGGRSFNVNITNTDMSAVNYNLVASLANNGNTYSIYTANVRWNSAQPVIQATGGQTGVVCNWRSGGGNTNMNAALASNTASAGWTFNFTGCCADLKHDMNTVTLGRVDGAIVNESGSTIGTPAAIGSGLIACFGTAAGSWKSLNPAKAANSY